MKRDESADTIAFAEKVFAILNEGSKSATYKYAVLMGLLDLCCEYHDDHGSPPESVTTTLLAMKVLEYYWPQALPYDETDRPLRQYTVKKQQAEIISKIWEARKKHAEAEGSPFQFKKLNERAFKSLLRKVEHKLAQEPLPRLQKVKGLSTEFIYRVEWKNGIGKTAFFKGDNVIRFLPDASKHMVKLRGLLRPMLQQEWTKWVSANTGIQDKVGKYLFPESRVPLNKVKKPLLDLQDSRCFYCEGKISKSAAVDHFLPWARTHNDNLGNLVVAHSDCNSSKSDYYAGSSHLEKWIERIESNRTDIEQISERALWPFQPRSSLGLARGIYLNLPKGVRLWMAKSTFEDYDRDRVGAALHLERG